MPRICYVERKFTPGSQRLIDQANQIIEEYAADGLVLTLRQLYYQYVSRDWLDNTMKEYKRLGSIINDARLAGLIDWDAITDRTRNLESNPHWSSPASIVSSCARQFRYDLWEDQPVRIECWIEKDALAGVFERPCRENDVAYFACRGYASQSEMWAAAMRLKSYVAAGQTPHILHFGDHDPSGIDMSRDIEDRLRLFMTDDADELVVTRVALNMPQVREYDPPPNPAKATDARFADYQRQYGDESWELDALNPRTLTQLVTNRIIALRNPTTWRAALRRQEEARAQIGAVSDSWDDIIARLEDATE